MLAQSKFLAETGANSTTSETRETYASLCLWKQLHRKKKRGGGGRGGGM